MCRLIACSTVALGGSCCAASCSDEMYATPRWRMAADAKPDTHSLAPTALKSPSLLLLSNKVTRSTTS